MTQRAPDPRRLDVAAFAAQGQSLDGSWPVAGMPRLLDSIDARAESNGSAAVVWHAAGEQTPPRGDAPRVWLRLAASAQVTMTCQRCLGPLAVPLAVERTFGFVAGEAPRVLALRLAIAKARAVARLAPHAAVIGSDQVADLDGRPLGKPGDRKSVV